MKPITITDVAQHAKVSKSTVSQYLNKRYDYMGESTKLRIEDSINELGYQPNYVARSLKQKSTKTIGVIVANILHNFSTEVSRAIEDACHVDDFHLIVCNADDDPHKEKKYIDMLRAKQVDGIIIFPTGGNIDLYEKMLREEYPVVFVDRSVPGLPVSSIMLKNEKAASMAVQHFITRGYRRIAIMTTTLTRSVTPRIERIEGYKDTLTRYKLPVRDDYINSVPRSDIQMQLDRMLQLDDPPEAILAGNDLTLIEILKYTKQHDIKIPDEIAIIGIDDVSFASFYTPAITTISQPTFEMGKKAAELLLYKIRQQKAEDQHPDYRFEPTLIERDSV
ncbi:substrate-binding domain-containing protein [Thalassobacillus sp. CUG 92003]|uniref:substrate-binding domain-containing protein n=1 Tax=Thalassobacillus sp. CUG 92003 TaxID=2736641 RepID=UPI0015E7CAD1|nr:substrate-binding domain-containing protein [Thalassobacillus sp. CUG 92003]